MSSHKMQSTPKPSTEEMNGMAKRLDMSNQATVMNVVSAGKDKQDAAPGDQPNYAAMTSPLKNKNAKS